MSILSKIKEAYLSRKFRDFFATLAIISFILLIFNIFLQTVDSADYFFTPFIFVFLSIILSIGTIGEEIVPIESKEDIKLLGDDYNIPNDPYDIYWNEDK
jgi:hypothetical protein